MAGISASLPALCCVCGALQSRASSAMPFPSVQQELSHSPSRNVPQFGSALLLLRSFFCHSISLCRKEDWSKKSLTLLPCSSCSVVVKSRYLVSLVRNSQIPGTGKMICSMLRSSRTICGKQSPQILPCWGFLLLPTSSCDFPSSLPLHSIQILSATGLKASKLPRAGWAKWECGNGGSMPRLRLLDQLENREWSSLSSSMGMGRGTAPGAK